MPVGLLPSWVETPARHNPLTWATEIVTRGSLPVPLAGLPACWAVRAMRSCQRSL